MARVDFSNYEVGDYLVHHQFGVGVYRGLIDFGDDDKDERLCLEYDDGGRIYVSVAGLSNIEFYASKFENNIEINNLSKRGAWKRRKNSAKKQSDEFVEDLVKNYSVRSSSTRTPYNTDIETESAFLESFKFDETIDQIKAWDDICVDLVSAIPMDRLLCGDVGFGKTEIAMRTAFRAVYTGKQVAVLTPTTILASQHFSTFKKRLSPFSIIVDLASGFRTQSELKNVFHRLGRGEVDIIIGTHALFSDHVAFKNLGLLIIDEEHRFGVLQKENFVLYNKKLDVLTMSATPIPRTLHMSLAGIKNISTMHSPPRARLPIITQVNFYNIELIKNAILLELNRGGQVFFVHNSIKSLDSVAKALNQYLPGVVIKKAHGREKSTKLEQTMIDFINAKIDVLVCTSIIESGIDIPNANTIIINRAHKMGLSQLYQMRGRVGRGAVQAYAYLLIPYGHNLSKNAFKRLKSIEKNSDLGSGFDISKADLEIRGAGTIFGYRQSGGVTRVGFGLYTRLINESLQKHNIIKRDFIIEPGDISISIRQKKSIPATFISSEMIRLEFYRKISFARTEQDLSEIKDEIQDRYGPPPASVDTLFRFSKILILCAKAGVKKLVEQSDGNWLINFIPDGLGGSAERLISSLTLFVKNKHGELRFFQEKAGVLGVRISIEPIKDNYSFILQLLNKLNTSFFEKSGA